MATSQARARLDEAGNGVPPGVMEQVCVARTNISTAPLSLRRRSP
jgi:hypothetical protein